MISDITAMFLATALMAIILFFIWSNSFRDLQLIHKFYLMLAGSYGLCVLALIGIKLMPPDNISALMILDAWTNIMGAFIPIFSLCITLTFVNGWNHMPRPALALFVVPIITSIIVCTNPLHHLQYQVFSVIRSEIVFGPYIVVAGLYGWMCMVFSLILTMYFGFHNRSRLYLMQSTLLALGHVFPLVVSIMATTTSDMSIAATPLSFIPTIVLNGIAIYRFNILDIKPIAGQLLLDGISDCYLILSNKGLVINYNQPFGRILASRYGIVENRYLKDCVKEEDIHNKTVMYNLMTAIESCREGDSKISYEQAMTVMQDTVVTKSYYVVDVTALYITEKLSGFVVVLKDVTELKKSMQRLQDNQARMMEQDRLASLGQMIGGVAHNLKTPIMSISGCISAVEELVDECEESLADPGVTTEDYNEIYREMRDWFEKMRESSSYMSDIITAIKGQAASVSTSEDVTFTVEDLIKRSLLLIRHELMASNCRVVSEGSYLAANIRGDINNLVQVLNNMISNAAYAQKQVGGGDIVIGVETDTESLTVFVKDTGPGFSPRVKQRLFKEMVTSKGTQGTGLGLYISDAVVRGKFGGSMWMEDNPKGGAVVGFTIPTDTAIETVKT